MYGNQVFKCFIHVTHIMSTLNRPLLKLPAIAFIMPIRSTSQILAGKRSKADSGPIYNGYIYKNRRVEAQQS